MTSTLVTGAAGFIGFHLAKKLLAEGKSVIGVDNLSDYYSTKLKEDRLNLLKENSNFSFHKLDLQDKNSLLNIFKSNKVEKVVNLAAQAGVRYSIDHPDVYIQSNIVGFLNLLEACRHHEIKHLVYASSSSVYGANREMPFSTKQAANHPLSLYAASKKSNEMMAHAYAHLYNIPATGLRFFTVYGPWGRPDMAIYSFTKSILEEKPINVFNGGQMKRDFTYVDDIVSGICLALASPAQANPNWDPCKPEFASSASPHRIYNVGNNKPIELSYFIDCLENSIGKKAQRNNLEMPRCDVQDTFADISGMEQDFNFQPETSIEEGVANFVAWFKEYYS